ncbi:MAG: nuclear transport factor 2 family protein [Elusimicrobia bacterium]|nr:nuclear transport factor 2 family protein [Elusimicrobiota bacterium]
METKSSASGMGQVSIEDKNQLIAQKTFEDFNRGDIPSILNALSKDVAWFTPGSRTIPFAGMCHGKEEVAGFFKKLDNIVVIENLQPKEYISQGDSVVALGSYEGYVKSTGSRFETDWAMLFVIKDGKITSFREYSDTENLAMAFQGS